MHSLLPRASERITRLSTLGESLELLRLGQGRSIDDLVAASGHAALAFAAVEAGEHEYDDARLAAIVAAYGIDRGERPVHAVVDLERGVISVATSKRTCDEPPADRVLLDYVSLLYHQNGLRVGTELPIREIDLTVVRRALALRRDAVEQRVATMVGEHALRRRRRPRLRRRHAALGGLVVMGAIVVIPPLAGRAGAAQGADQVLLDAPVTSPLVVAPVGDIGTALTIERTDGADTRRSDTSPAPVRVIAPTAPEVDAGSLASLVASFRLADAPTAPAPPETTAAPTPDPASPVSPAAGAPVGDIGTALVIER